MPNHGTGTVSAGGILVQVQDHNLWRDERDLSEDRVRIDLIDVFISAAVLVVAAKLDEAEGLLARQEGHDHGHDRANRRADVG